MQENNAERWGKWFRNVNERLRKITKTLDIAGFKVDRLQCDVAQVIQNKQTPGFPPESGVPSILPPTPPPGALPVGPQARQAVVGVTTLHIDEQPDGSAIAYVDGKPVRLPPGPALLLKLLEADSILVSDSLVGWKRVAELQEKMAKKPGQPLSSGALNNVIYRLRRALWSQAGLAKDYIQRKGQEGLIRFARRRDPENGGL